MAKLGIILCIATLSTILYTRSPRVESLIETNYVKHGKLWWTYITGMGEYAITNLREQRMLSSAIRRLMEQLEPTRWCPQVHYDSIMGGRAGNISTLCGRLTLVLDPSKSSQELWSVYSIEVPQLFYLNVSFLGFHSVSGTDYPVCGWNDIVIKQNDQVLFKLCGKPFQLSMFIESTSAQVLSFHDPQVKSDPSSLVLLLEFQASTRHPNVNVSSLGFIALPERGYYRKNLAEVTYIDMLEECTSRLNGSYRHIMNTVDTPNRAINSTLSSLSEMLTGLHNVRDIQDLQSIDHIESLGYIAASQTQSFCNKLPRHKEYTQMDFQETLESDSGLLSMRSNSLNTMPTYIYDRQTVTNFTTIHILWLGSGIKSVRVWSLHSFLFNDSGYLSLKELSVYLPQQNCTDRHSDSLTVFEGPYAGIMTPNGLTTPFAIIASKTCHDLITGETFNSSMGDITVLWSNPLRAKASISFAYLNFPSNCPSQVCDIKSFPVKLGETRITRFSGDSRPSVNILKFSALDSQATVKMQLWIRDNSFPYYVAECRISGIFLVERTLKASFCSDRSLKLLNSTMEESGIQFGPEVWIVVKCYQIDNIEFLVEYSGTSCFGLLNVCLNSYNPSEIYNYQCSPVMSTGGFVCNTSPRILLKYANPNQSCCLQVTDLGSDLVGCPLPTQTCSYDITLLRHFYRNFPSSFVLTEFPTDNQ